MKALITGVTGFAGGYLTEQLLRCGDEVMGVARESTWPAATPNDIPKRTQLRRWDITHTIDDALYEEIAAFQPDVIFHLAGMSVPGDCGTDTPTPAAEAANVTGVARVLELIQRLPSRPRLAFASSCQVYSPVSEADPRVAEDSPLGPDRAYGMTKLAAERLILAAAESGQLDYVILRAFNHAGPRQAPRMMLSEWAHQLAARPNGVLRVISRGSHLDLTDVRDTVRAYRDLAASAAAGVYNVGSGRSICSGDVLDLLLHRYHANVDVEELRPGRRQLPIANIERLQRAIDWKPEVSLEQTIDDTMQYWTEQTQ